MVQPLLEGDLMVSHKTKRTSLLDSAKRAPWYLPRGVEK
jgi:hypothetical protein